MYPSHLYKRKAVLSAAGKRRAHRKRKRMQVLADHLTSQQDQRNRQNEALRLQQKELDKKGRRARITAAKVRADRARIMASLAE